jgi:hypothetical protein
MARRRAGAGSARFAVRELRAPGTVAVAQTFLVRLRVHDTLGVASVELRFGAERQILHARGQRVASLSARITPRHAGLVTLEVVPRGPDGTSGTAVRKIILVTPRTRAPAGAMTRPTLERRIADWERRGLTEDEPYARGPLYAGSATVGPLAVTTDWWVNWLKAAARQPFGWAGHCESAAGITPNGEVLRCWLALTPLVAVSIVWDELLSNGYAHPVPYPFWPEWRKQELDQVFYDDFESMVRELVTHKRLVRVLDAYCPEVPGYFLYYPSRANIAPKLKALVDFVKRARGGRAPGSSKRSVARS